MTMCNNDLQNLSQVQTGKERSMVFRNYSDERAHYSVLFIKGPHVLQVTLTRISQYLKSI